MGFFLMEISITSPAATSTYQFYQYEPDSPVTSGTGVAFTWRPPFPPPRPRRFAALLPRRRRSSAARPRLTVLAHLQRHLRRWRGVAFVRESRARRRAA